MKKPLRFWRTLDMKFIIRGQLQAFVLDLRMKQQVFILPHPGSIMKEWMIKVIYLHLKEHGHIK